MQFRIEEKNSRHKSSTLIKIAVIILGEEVQANLFKQIFLGKVPLK